MGRTAHRRSRGIALLFLDHGTRRRWGVSITFWSLFTPGKHLVPLVQEAGWAPAPVWTGAENLAPTGIRSPDRPACSQSLYRLHYPANTLMLHRLATKALFNYIYKKTRTIKACNSPIGDLLMPSACTFPVTEGCEIAIRSFGEVDGVWDAMGVRCIISVFCCLCDGWLLTFSNWITGSLTPRWLSSIVSDGSSWQEKKNCTGDCGGGNHCKWLGSGSSHKSNYYNYSLLALDNTVFC